MGEKEVLSKQLYKIVIINIVATVLVNQHLFCISRSRSCRLIPCRSFYPHNCDHSCVCLWLLLLLFFESIITAVTAAVVVIVAFSLSTLPQSLLFLLLLLLLFLFRINCRHHRNHRHHRSCSRFLSIHIITIAVVFDADIIAVVFGIDFRHHRRRRRSSGKG